MSAPTRPIVYSFPDTSNLSDSLAEYILKAQKESIDKRRRFTVAISGGSLPKTLTALITKPGVQWDKWQVAASFFSLLSQPHRSSHHPSRLSSLGMFSTPTNASCPSSTKTRTTSSHTTRSTPKCPSRATTCVVCKLAVALLYACPSIIKSYTVIRPKKSELSSKTSLMPFTGSPAARSNVCIRFTSSG